MTTSGRTCSGKIGNIIICLKHTLGYRSQASYNNNFVYEKTTTTCRHLRVLIRLFVIIIFLFFICFWVFFFIFILRWHGKAKMNNNNLSIVFGWLDREVWLLASIMEMTACACVLCVWIAVSRGACSWWRSTVDNDDDDEWNQQSFVRPCETHFLGLMYSYN